MGAFGPAGAEEDPGAGANSSVVASQSLIWAEVRRKSGFFSTSFVTSKTQAGPMNFLGGMRSTEESGKSLPVIQWTGASKWVPVCSPVSKAFQYQKGPRES